ncbi:hypothetical protein Gotur_011193 [Gossypium turneri]
MGVAFCCIFVCDDASSDGPRCRAVIHDRYSSRKVHWSGWSFASDEQVVTKDHIFIRYFSRDKLYPIFLEDKCGEHDETKNLRMIDCLDQECYPLELSMISLKYRLFKVKKCGVRIVHEKNLEEMEQIQELHSSQCCANCEHIQQHSTDDGSIEWFSQQRGDFWIQIDLPLEVRNDSQWIGVALCCIFVSGDTSRNEHLNKCDERETNNLWITDCLDQECDQLELSFTGPYSVNAKNCGVRIVYK